MVVSNRNQPRLKTHVSARVSRRVFASKALAIMLMLANASGMLELPPTLKATAALPYIWLTAPLNSSRKINFVVEATGSKTEISFAFYGFVPLDFFLALEPRTPYLPPDARWSDKSHGSGVLSVRALFAFNRIFIITCLKN